MRLLRALRSSRRHERGAAAILVAGLAVVLLGVGAIAVDMGQVYAKRASLQNAADMAALAAGAYLDGSNTCSADARNAAEAYLRDNWIDSATDPITVNLGGSPSDGDGFIQCTKWQVKVWAPSARVDYGLARIVLPKNSTTDEGILIPAASEVGVFSPRANIMPAFAVTGCDYGPQTLLDPPSGGPYVATLPESTAPYDDATLTSLSVTQMDVGQSISPFVINGKKGKKFKDITYVAFSTESGMHYEYPVSGSNPAITVNDSKGEITLNYLPSIVRDTQEVWWVRVSDDSSNPTSWTDPTDALSLQVGSPLLTCAGVSNSGNFGTLDLPSLDPSASGEKAIEWNILTAVDFSLTTFPGSTSGYCSPGTGGAIGPPSDGTNCVGSKTGFAGNPATAGLIAGNGSTPGVLTRVDTRPGCAPNGGSSNYSTPKMKGDDYSINDDTLTCYFNNNATTVAQVSNASYSGAPLVSGDVFSSPRFWWVPVFKVQPSNGSSNDYSIIDFRPAFITGELAASTKSQSYMDTSTDNGMAFSSSGIQTLKVVFFADKTLPASMASGEVMTYLGSGTRVLRITN